MWLEQCRADTNAPAAIGWRLLIRWQPRELVHEPRGQITDTNQDHDPATQVRCPERGGQQFFNQHERRNGRNPQQVHHSTHEQQAHEQPAATQAIHAIARPIRRFRLGAEVPRQDDYPI